MHQGSNQDDRPPHRDQPASVPESARRLGVVKWYDRKQACGFIRPRDGGVDVFINGQLLDDQLIAQLVREPHVSYTVKESPKGPIACDLRIIPDHPKPHSG